MAKAGEGTMGSALAATLLAALAACTPGPRAGDGAGEALAVRPPAITTPSTPAARGDLEAASPDGANAAEAMREVQIIDANGFAQPLVAATAQVPDGWQTVGGVAWNDSTPCIGNQLQVSWGAVAPDGLRAVEILPGFNWQVAGTEIQMNPCPAAPYRSARDLLEATVQRTRPGARILDYQSQPELAQATDAARNAQRAGEATQARQHADAGRLLIGYASAGVEMREALSAVVTLSEMQGNVVGGAGIMHSVRGPATGIDLDVGARIIASLRHQPQWAEAVGQRNMASLQRVTTAQSRSIDDWHNRQMAIINARGAADRAAIRMRGNAEVAAINGATAAANSASSEQMHRRAIAGIREVNNFAGVDGTSVESSIHGGSRVFQDTGNPGNAYSTDAPYHTPTGGYVELEPEP